MSTLEYLDDRGTVNFRYVPWTLLNRWLSKINGNPNVDDSLPIGVNRGKVIEELHDRRTKTEHRFTGAMLKAAGRSSRGYGNDWKEETNEDGYTHLEELLIYQPDDWRKQAREYLFCYDWSIQGSQHIDRNKRTANVKISTRSGSTLQVAVVMELPILVVLFHPKIKRTKRYEPLNFLLSYGAEDPLHSVSMQISSSLGSHRQEEVMKSLILELSPLDYFLSFRKHVDDYDMDELRRIGQSAKFPRLCLIKELDFSNVVGQRLAKKMIREEVVEYVASRCQDENGLCMKKQPLSMIWAGPSGVGKTEMAEWLAALLNKPGEDAFHKVDCGKITKATEFFGRSGAYIGAEKGSELNNFILRMSSTPDIIGVVLLDEIEKVDRDVIHGLYQVLDKAEWTNKKLGEQQTETIACDNIVFVMTTNAADAFIGDLAKKEDVYTASLESLADMLESRIRRTLQTTRPFTKAFMGRIETVVPFLPMGNGDPAENVIAAETSVVTKLLIEREQEKLSVKQEISPATKDQMALVMMADYIEEAGVRGIQKLVAKKMGKQVRKTLLRRDGGVREGNSIRYSASMHRKSIDFRVEAFGDSVPATLELPASSEWQTDDDIFA